MIAIGIDPGTAATAWACLDVAPRGTATLIGAGAWPIETDAALVVACEWIAETPRAYGARLVGVERVREVHGSQRMGSAYARGLAESNWIGGELRASARAARLPTITVAATRWRSDLVGKPSPADAAIKSALRVRVRAWPKVSNAHVRDAAMIAIWSALTVLAGGGA